MVRRSLFYFLDSSLFGSLTNGVGEEEIEEIDDERGKCGCSSSILSFRNYNHEKRCTKGGEVLSCISFHQSVSRV